MHRRTLLVSTGTVGLALLSGCLGTRTIDPADGGTDGEHATADGSVDNGSTDDASSGDGTDDPNGATGEPTDGTADGELVTDSTTIDPDAHYVIEGPEGPFSAKGPLNTDLEGVAIHGYDLVAYFEEHRPVRGEPRHEVEYADVRFRFASAANRETFADRPDSYLPEFGGYCSLGVGNGYKDGMHPEAFELIAGKLYFNLTPSIHEAWLHNAGERIETAERNWPEIKDSLDPIHIGPGL